MANMSYCKFQNTANDLADCLSTLKEIEEGELQDFINNLSSDREQSAYHRLIGLCQGIVNVVKILENNDAQPKTFTLEEIQEADDNQQGFCLACGALRDCCEPDAHKYECEECGKRQVYGAQEIALMGLVH